MTTINFGDQHDKAKATFDIASADNSNTTVSVGNQYNESTRSVSIRDASISSTDGADHTLSQPTQNQISSERAELRRDENMQRLNAILAFAFGLILIATILTLVIIVRDPTTIQKQVFSVVLALAAGGFATVLSGMLNVRLSLGNKAVIGATGALAVFVIVYFFVPAMGR